MELLVRRHSFVLLVDVFKYHEVSCFTGSHVREGVGYSYTRSLRVLNTQSVATDEGKSKYNHLSSPCSGVLFHPVLLFVYPIPVLP